MPAQVSNSNMLALSAHLPPPCRGSFVGCCSPGGSRASSSSPCKYPRWLHPPHFHDNSFPTPELPSHSWLFHSCCSLQTRRRAKPRVSTLVLLQKLVLPQPSEETTVEAGKAAAVKQKLVLTSLKARTLTLAAYANRNG